VVFGFFKKSKRDDEDEVDYEPVSFLGPTSGKEVNLKPHARLVEAGLLPAKDLISDALSRRADSLRIEPKGALANVVVSVDGIPYPGDKLSKQEATTITQMLKVLAGLDIKQRQTPQRGGLNAEFESKKYILTVITAPVPDGERLTVRFTDLSIKLDSAADLGMGDAMRLRLREVCKEPGLLAVVGPPGSGTTTSLYGVLRNVDAYIYTVYTLCNTGGRKLLHIHTLDELGGPAEDLGSTLTKAIRRECNVALCDPITSAEIAKVYVSKHEDLTVITEFPAKDTPSAVLQLIQWVGNPELVARALRGVVTQKMLRRLCENCRVAYRPKAEFLKKLGLRENVGALYKAPPPPPEDEEPDCRKCGGEGYLSRVAMFEFLENTEGMREVIASKPDAAAIKAQMKKDKMTTLQIDGLRLVEEGITSLEELQRVFKATAS